MSTLHLPYIIERSSRGERTYDIYSRLLMDRIIFLGSQINDDVANIVIAQLLFLEADSPGKDIQLYINSPGGDVSAGLAIYDTMQHLSSPVATICMGMAASMGCFLLAAGSYYLVERPVLRLRGRRIPSFAASRPRRSAVPVASAD